jgi:hypothetical protein
MFLNDAYPKRRFNLKKSLPLPQPNRTVMATTIDKQTKDTFSRPHPSPQTKHKQ